MDRSERSVPDAAMRLRPELQFVIECVRRSCGASPRLLPAVGDWLGVLQIATEQTVLPALDATLRTAESVAPASIRHLVQAGAAVAIERQQAVQEPGARLTLKTLAAAGCQPVVLKGVALAYSRYPRPEARLFSDIDVLVPPRQLGAAEAALLSAGFRADLQAEVGSGHQHLPPLLAPGDAIIVELHRQLFDDACPFTLNVDEMLQRSRAQTILGVPVRVLEPVDALLHACAHLSYGHRYTRLPLRSVADVLVLTQHRDIDWHDVVRRTQGAQMSGAVVWPLALATAWYGAPIPRGVLQALAPPNPLARWIATVMRTGHVIDPSSAANDGTRVLHDWILERSIFTGCSSRTQWRTAMRGLFPAPAAVTHLPPETYSSPIRYLREFVTLRRLSRGASAFLRLTRASARGT